MEMAGAFNGTPQLLLGDVKVPFLDEDHTFVAGSLFHVDDLDHVVVIGIEPEAAAGDVLVSVKLVEHLPSPTTLAPLLLATIALVDFFHRDIGELDGVSELGENGFGFP